METPVVIEVIERAILPILTLLGGWFAHVVRTKQKKESDILDNVRQILEMQKQYIAQQDEENKKTRNMNARLEKKLDDKRESIRKANHCKFTSEGDGCPVLRHEDELDEKCKNCNLNQNDSSEAQNR